MNIIKSILFFYFFLMITGFDHLKSQNTGILSNKIRIASFDIDSVLQYSDEDKTVMAIDNYINQISNYGNHIGKLTEPQKTFLFIENLEREVNNGGFNQFYFNPTGDYSQETVDALLVIGAKKTANIVKIANAQFPENPVPKDRDRRRKLLIKIEKKANEIWDECDKMYYKYEDNLSCLLVKYVKEHKEDFK